MPPRTRGVKASKENVDILAKTKVKTIIKASRPSRKPLADKTNSASDENVSPEGLKKVIKNVMKKSRKVVPEVIEEDRPRRNRRLPTRYVENQVLKNLSNSKEITATQTANTPVKDALKVQSPSKTPTNGMDSSLISNRPRRVSRLPSRFDENSTVKDASKVQSPSKTPNTGMDNSLISNRPRRVSRLPSKFEENSTSPKLVSIQPCHTSTPLLQKSKEQPKATRLLSQRLKSQEKSPLKAEKKTPKTVVSLKVPQQKVTLKKPIIQKNTVQTKTTPQKVTPLKVSRQTSSQKSKLTQKKVIQKKSCEVVNHDEITNANGIQRVRRLRKPIEYKELTLSPKPKTPENLKSNNAEGKKITKLNSSFRVLEDKNTKKVDGQDIYEFTFDPSEEPAPKTRKKKVANKKPAKPRIRVYNNNYEKNLARALADLKNTVSKQKVQNEKQTPETSKPNPLIIMKKKGEEVRPNKPTVPTPSAQIVCTTADIHSEPVSNHSIRKNALMRNHDSIRIEDIAADFEAPVDHYNDINYSPVNSPDRMNIESENTQNASLHTETVRFDDPLNLQNDLSFFDDQPAASSSMNVSSRNPNATPWRVEFESLPIKWQANTYVKPDMTPALESSYINNFDGSKNRHVYTNIVPEANETLPEIIENDAPKLKQTSIISFIKEVVEKSANKKKRQIGATKANSLFDDSNTSVNPAVSNKISNTVAPTKETSGTSTKGNSASAENNLSPEDNRTIKRKNGGDINPTPIKVPRKINENSLFGFESENEEQENISPVGTVPSKRLRSLRSRSGAVLKDLNKQTGPMRADIPTAMKSKLGPSSEAVEKIYEQIKSATDAPVFLDKQGDDDVNMATNIVDAGGLDDGSQSVHLFEDVELVHHLKPTRKSYGKSKKVTFAQNSNSSDGDVEMLAARNLSSDDDDADDLSFHLPEVKPKKATKRKKKATKKQLLSKKEKEEVDAWAAGFNSMCEDIEGFDLVVE